MDLFGYGRKIRLKQISADVGKKEKRRHYSSFLIALPVGNELQNIKKRWKVESTFEDMKSRGWDWEESHVRRLDRVDRMLLVLFLMLWWLIHLAASCIHHGKRDRYDRHDRRDKNVFRIGRLYLLDIERRARRVGNTRGLKICQIFQGKPGQWRFSLRF
jgi:Transposase DDE domain